MRFEDLEFNNLDDPYLGSDAIQCIKYFDNGYGVSIIRHRRSYGYSKGLYELAVLFDGGLCYDTPITDDVLGHLTAQEVEDIVNKVIELPAVSPEQLEGEEELENE